MTGIGQLIMRHIVTYR